MPDIDNIASRPREYLAGTGVPGLVGGLIWFFLGSSVLIQQALPRGFMPQEIPGWIATCCCVTVLLGARALKRRIVFPRGGYVELRPRPAIRFIFVAFLALAILLTIFAIAWPGRLPAMDGRLIEPGFAIASAILCLAFGSQQKSTWGMLFGVYLVGLAALLWLMPAGSHEGMARLQVGMGAPVAVAGAIRLRRFLKANPRPVETANE
jgi:hypothetical protein